MGFAPVHVEPRQVHKVTVVFEDNFENRNAEDGDHPLFYAKKSDPDNSAADDGDEAFSNNKDEDRISDDLDADNEEDAEEEDNVVAGEATPSNKNGHILIHLKYSILTPMV